jgi:hypothetical protein
MMFGCNAVLRLPLPSVSANVLRGPQQAALLSVTWLGGQAAPTLTFRAVLALDLPLGGDARWSTQVMPGHGVQCLCLRAGCSQRQAHSESCCRNMLQNAIVDSVDGAITGYR